METKDELAICGSVYYSERDQSVMYSTNLSSVYYQPNKGSFRKQQ